jgi:hypothetical protein
MWTLRNRLVLVNVLIFLLTFVVLVGVLAGQLVGHLLEQLDRQLVESAERVAGRVVVVKGEPQLSDADGRLGASLGPHGFVRVLNAQGAATGGVGRTRMRRHCPRACWNLSGGCLVTSARPTANCCASIPSRYMRPCR